ncbi:hypothetical protein ABPG72_008816 [Tetrahymena utriculariae]
MEEMKDIEFQQIKQEMQDISKQVFQQMIGDYQRIPSKIEIQEFGITQQFTCALTFETMKQPAKTKNCMHFWGIELEYFKVLKECPCKQPITEDNIIIDDLLSRLIKITDQLNDIYFSQDERFRFQNEIFLFQKSLIFFPCYEQQAFPKPLIFLQEHIKSADGFSLNYNFCFKKRYLTQVKYKTIARVCQQLCLYDFDNLNFNSQIEQCQFCGKSIDVFNFQIDDYLMKVRSLLQYFELNGIDSSQESVNMMHGKFKIQKQLYTIENIGCKLSQLQPSK